MLSHEQPKRLYREELMKLRGSAGWTAYTDASIALESGGWVRTHGDRGRAEHLYREVVEASVGEPVRRTFALSGLAELERAEGYDNSALADEIRAVLLNYPMVYIDAHLTVADFLAGRVDAAAGLARIAAVEPGLRPERA